MRFGSKTSLRTSTACTLEKKEILQKILMTNLGLNYTDVEQVIDKKSILNAPHHRVLSNCLICQKYNVNAKPLKNLGSYLRFLTYKAEHRINMFKDIGVSELNLSLVSKMVSLFHKDMCTFKEIVNIPAEQNITRNIFDRLGCDVPSDISKLESSSNKVMIRQYYEACLLHCKTRVFDLPYLNDEILLHKYMKFKSISMMAETLKVLRIDLDYDQEMIKRSPAVITASADNVRLLLNEFTDICEIPIVTFLRKYPFMLFCDVDNIKRLLVSFKQYEIPDIYVQKCVRILKMDNNTFVERMEIMKRNPDLHLWYKHSRILQMVLRKNLIETRMGYLHMMSRMKWACPNTMLCGSDKLDEFLQTNAGITTTKEDLGYMLKMELGVDKSELLAKHQHWNAVGFIDIEQMLKYLKKHFTISEICQNIHIVLYSQSIVEKLLADLKRQYSQNTKYSFTNSQYLAFCLYILEKDTNFTGDGIWNNAKQQFLKDENTAEDSNDTNTIKNIYSNTKNIDDIEHHDLSDKHETFYVTKQQCT